ncbi:hypothetical protein ACSFE6_04810 [Pseudomonas baetica]|uniref:hypothetical protein n=1 Tax=Pseudomonas baetica TaxID=674054 RepID=UPI003EEA803A
MNYEIREAYREDVVSADILHVLNYHAKHITGVQRIDLASALAALVGSLGGDTTQRIGSLSIEAPVAPQRARDSWVKRVATPDIPHNPFTVPNDAPKHISLIAN